MMTWIMQMVIASGLPGTGKGKKAKVSYNNRGLDEWRISVEKGERWLWPQYLVEPPYIKGAFEGSRILI
jgi:hypothetical protein